MHIQAHAMPGGMGKAAALSLRVSLIQEDLRDPRMNLFAGNARPDGLKALVLRQKHSLVDLFYLRRGFAFENGARHIGKVPAALRARKDIDDNGSIGCYWTRSSRMRS